MRTEDRVRVEKLVDRFVKLVNAGRREEMPLDEVPAFLQDGKPDGVSVGWKIVKMDNSDCRVQRFVDASLASG
jgi:hypothetical protein